MSELPADPVVVVTNGADDCSPEAFRGFVVELLAGPDPELETIDAAEALRHARVDAQA